MSLTALSPSHSESVRELADHPAIEEMARDLLTAPPEMLAVLIVDGHPTSRFMGMANDRFTERTGEHGRFLGSVSRAVVDRMEKLRAAALPAQLAALPSAVTEARAAELEARQAIRDMFAYGFSHCPITRYAEAAGRVADRFYL
jgi:predicted ester cyclase